MLAAYKFIDQLPDDKRRLWVAQTAAIIHDHFITKYLKGQREHACDLGKVGTHQLLDEMEAEALDMLAYVYELRRRSKGVRAESDQEIHQFDLPLATHEGT